MTNEARQLRSYIRYLVSYEYFAFFVNVAAIHTSLHRVFPTNGYGGRRLAFPAWPTVDSRDAGVTGSRSGMSGKRAPNEALHSRTPLSSTNTSKLFGPTSRLRPIKAGFGSLLSIIIGAGNEPEETKGHAKLGPGGPSGKVDCHMQNLDRANAAHTKPDCTGASDSNQRRGNSTIYDISHIPKLAHLALL